MKKKYIVIIIAISILLPLFVVWINSENQKAIETAVEIKKTEIASMKSEGITAMIKIGVFFPMEKDGRDVLVVKYDVENIGNNPIDYIVGNLVIKDKNEVFIYRGEQIFRPWDALYPGKKSEKNSWDAIIANKYTIGNEYKDYKLTYEITDIVYASSN